MGPQGTPGRDGIPGYSGVNVSVVQGTNSLDKIVLIPPSISGRNI